MKIMRDFIKNSGKLKDFTLSSIAGMFSGLSIGIFFSLTTDITFNGWIKDNFLTNVISFLFLIFIFYFLGRFIIVKCLLSDKKRELSFHLNFIAGIFSSSFTFLLILYHKNLITAIMIGVVLIILFFIVAHFAIREKHNK